MTSRLPRKRRTTAPSNIWLARVGLCLIVLAAYSNSFQSGFVLDNRVLILEDARVHAATADNFWKIVNHSYWWPYIETGLYRPVTTLSYLFNYAVAGNADRPAGYHVVNLVLHAANVLLVFAIALRIIARAIRLRDTGAADLSELDAGRGEAAGSQSWSGVLPAASIAALWAAHPLSTEAVTNIVGRADLLAAFGVLGAFYAYLRATERRQAAGVKERATDRAAQTVAGSGRPEDRPAKAAAVKQRRDPGRLPARPAWLIVSAVALTVGMFSKESAVAGVAIIVLYDLSASADGPLATARAAAWRWLAFAPPLFLLWSQRQVVLAGAQTSLPFVDNPIVGAGLVRGRLMALSVMGRYLWLAVWPAHLSPDYSFAQIPLFTGSPAEVLSCATVLAVAALAMYAWIRGQRMSFFLPAAAFLALLPASNLLFVTGTIMGERLMYLPLVFVCAAAVVGAYAVADAAGSPRLATTALLVVAIVFAIRTWARNPEWRDELTLWSSAVRVAPDSFKTHGGLAEALYKSTPDRGNLDRVIAEKEKSLALIAAVPEPASAANPFREAAAYYLEYGEWLDAHAPRASGDVDAAYRKAMERANRYLSLTAGGGGGSVKDRADMYLLVSTAAARLKDAGQAVQAARAAGALAPLNPAAYRATASAFLQANRGNDAAVELMAGFMITGELSLRTALVDLYRKGLDAAGCAVRNGPSGVVLDQNCAIVRRHLCAAALQAMDVHRRSGHLDLANQIQATTYGPNGCAEGQPASIER